MAIGGLALDGAPLELAAGLLATGFHPPERQGRVRWAWTDGAGTIALPPMPHGGCLGITLAGFGVRHWAAASPSRRAAG